MSWLARHERFVMVTVAAPYVVAALEWFGGLR